MSDKNNPGKFTVQFSLSDPCHRQTADILNEQGRRKAQFIVNAVMHYINCSETPNISQPVIDNSLIESIVRRIMEEQQPQKKEDIPRDTRTVKKSQSINFSNAEDLLGADGIATIKNSMASFRSR